MREGDSKKKPPIDHEKQCANIACNCGNKYKLLGPSTDFSSLVLELNPGNPRTVAVLKTPDDKYIIVAVPSLPYTAETDAYFTDGPLAGVVGAIYGILDPAGGDKSTIPQLDAFVIPVLRAAGKEAEKSDNEKKYALAKALKYIGSLERQEQEKFFIPKIGKIGNSRTDITVMTHKLILSVLSKLLELLINDPTLATSTPEHSKARLLLDPKEEYQKLNHDYERLRTAFSCTAKYITCPPHDQAWLATINTLKQLCRDYPLTSEDYLLTSEDDPLTSEDYPLTYKSRLPLILPPGTKITRIDKQTPLATLNQQIAEITYVEGPTVEKSSGAAATKTKMDVMHPALLTDKELPPKLVTLLLGNNPLTIEDVMSSVNDALFHAATSGAYVAAQAAEMAEGGGAEATPVDPAPEAPEVQLPAKERKPAIEANQKTILITQAIQFLLSIQRYITAEIVNDQYKEIVCTTFYNTDEITLKLKLDAYANALISLVNTGFFHEEFSTDADIEEFIEHNQELKRNLLTLKLIEVIAEAQIKAKKTEMQEAAAAQKAKKKVEKRAKKKEAKKANKTEQRLAAQAVINEPRAQSQNEKTRPKGTKAAQRKKGPEKQETTTRQKQPALTLTGAAEAGPLKIKVEIDSLQEKIDSLQEKIDSLQKNVVTQKQTIHSCINTLSLKCTSYKGKDLQRRGSIQALKAKLANKAPAVNVTLNSIHDIEQFLRANETKTKTKTKAKAKTTPEVTIQTIIAEANIIKEKLSVLLNEQQSEQKLTEEKTAANVQKNKLTASLAAAREPDKKDAVAAASGGGATAARPPTQEKPAEKIDAAAIVIQQWWRENRVEASHDDEDPKEALDAAAGLTT